MGRIVLVYVYLCETTYINFVLATRSKNPDLIFVIILQPQGILAIAKSLTYD